MSPHDVRKALVEALTEIQTLSGRKASAFTDDLCPADDLEGFDSLNAEETAVALEKKLGIELKENPFVVDDRNLRIHEIVKRVCETATTSKGR